jgi:hypothetical protein
MAMIVAILGRLAPAGSQALSVVSTPGMLVSSVKVNAWLLVRVVACALLHSAATHCHLWPVVSACRRRRAFRLLINLTNILYNSADLFWVPRPLKHCINLQDTPETHGRGQGACHRQGQVEGCVPPFWLWAPGAQPCCRISSAQQSVGGSSH